MSQLELEKSVLSNTSTYDDSLGSEASSLISSSQESKSTCSLLSSDSEDEFPDLEAVMARLAKTYSEGSIVWAFTKGLWWPGYIKKVYERQKKVSIIFINSQQTQNIRLPFSRLKNFGHLNFLHMIAKQKDKNPFIKDAIQIAHNYIYYRGQIEQPAPEFFALPLNEQWRILNKFILEEGAPKVDTGDVTEAPGPIRKLRRRPLSTGPINQVNRVSREERRKIASLKAEEKLKKQCLRYIKSKKLLTHLENISKGKTQSSRHDTFKEIKDKPCLWEIYLRKENPAFDFFGENGDDLYKQVVQVLTDRFVDAEFEFEAHSSVQRMYAILVLVPEAFKMYLLDKRKMSENQVEITLVKGPFTPKKDVLILPHFAQ